jgi:hypothetical protein
MRPVVRTEHEYQLCYDPHCERFPCRVYKEGLEAGERIGYDAGYAAGHSQGWNDGYAAGSA